MAEPYFDNDQKCILLHSLIRDDLEDQVIEQSELFGDLQGRVALKRLVPALLHRLKHTRTHTNTIL